MKWKMYWWILHRSMIIFFSNHIPTSHFYPNIQCIIYVIDTDSHINIACNIATKKIMSHLNVISLYYKYKQNYMGPLFTIYKLKEIIEFARIKTFPCAYWSPLTQDLLLSSACVCLWLVVINKKLFHVNDPLMWAYKWFLLSSYLYFAIPTKMQYNLNYNSVLKNITSSLISIIIFLWQVLLQYQANSWYYGSIIMNSFIFNIFDVT